MFISSVGFASKKQSISSIAVSVLLLISLSVLYFLPDNQANLLYKLLRPFLAFLIVVFTAILTYRSSQIRLRSEIESKDIKNNLSALRLRPEEVDLSSVPIYAAEKEYKNYIETFLGAVGDTFVARAAAFYMGGSRIKLQSAVPADEAQEFHNELSMGDGIVSKVLQSEKTILVKSFNDIEENVDYLKDPLSVKSFLGTPVFYNEKSMGVLFVDSRAEDSFGESDKRLIESFAVIIEKTVIQLDSIFNLQNRLTLISELYRFFLSIQRAQRFDQVYKNVAHTCKSLIKYDALTISLLDEDSSDKLIIKFRSGAEDKYAEDFEYSINEGMNGLVFKKNSPIIVPETEEGGYFKPRFENDEESTGNFHSYIGTPIYSGKNVLGVIGLDSKSPANYSNTDKAILTSLGAVMGLALSRLTLLKEKSSNTLTDELTGLQNIKFFRMFIENVILRAERYDETFTVLIIDVHKFGKINKRYGDKAGDILLKEIGEKLGQEIRSSDIVSRYGGDEFGIVLLDYKQKAVDAFTNRIQELIRTMVFEYNNESITLKIDLGSASYPKNGETADELISIADKDMIKNKSL